jgi:CubicO group peptidase (beta-lactamase class C family)
VSSIPNPEAVRYTLLGEIVKRVSGQSFLEFTTSRIFQPLGMKNSHFRDDHAEVIKHQALGYVRAKDVRAKDGFRLSVSNFDTVGAFRWILLDRRPVCWLRVPEPTIAAASHNCNLISTSLRALTETG